MKFRFASDLHLEFAFSKNFGFLKYTSSNREMVTKFRDYADHLLPPLPEDSNTVLILAGDICEGWRAHTRYFGFFDRLSARFLMVLWVAGNHEYYGHKISPEHKLRIQNAVGSTWENVAFMNKRHVLVRGPNEPKSEWVSVLGTTMWTSFNRGDPLATFQASTVMGDYRHITHADVPRDIYRVLRVRDVQDLFQDEWAWLKSKMNEIREHDPQRKILVVTHHAPSHKSLHQRYVDRPSLLNYAYFEDLPLDYLEGGMPNVWIHGHLHDSVDYRLGDLNVLSNPFGYIGDHINSEYNPYAVFDMEDYHVGS